MLEMITSVNGFINGLVWGPYMLALLVGTGIYLTVRVGFIQVTKFAYAMKETLGSLFTGPTEDEDDNNITPFQAVSTALASTVGTGNIAGVATAITLGGPGAVFWMWFSAFFGMVTKYAEVVLAVHFREQNAAGENIGGPMYYIEKGLNMKWLAVLFACFATLATFGIGNLTQANSVATAVKTIFNVDPRITAIVLMVITAAVILGGIRSIAKVNEKLVPIMAVFYVVAGVIILFINRAAIPGTFALIFEHAFTLNSAAGGAAGYTMMMAMRYGVARGVFSNEAGLGSAPIAHAASRSKDPVAQGLWGIFEVFLDTMIICSMTALIVLTSGMWQSGAEGAALSILAFDEALPVYGGMVVSIGLVLFATSTMFGWAYYGEKSLEYLFRDNKTVIVIYRVLYVGAIYLGATGGLKLVWDIADTLNGLMAIPNLIALLGLSGIIVRLTKEHFDKVK